MQAKLAGGSGGGDTGSTSQQSTAEGGDGDEGGFVAWVASADVRWRDELWAAVLLVGWLVMRPPPRVRRRVNPATRRAAAAAAGSAAAGESGVEEVRSGLLSDFAANGLESVAGAIETAADAHVTASRAVAASTFGIGVGVAAAGVFVGLGMVAAALAEARGAPSRHGPTHCKRARVAHSPKLMLASKMLAGFFH